MANRPRPTGPQARTARRPSSTTTTATPRRGRAARLGLIALAACGAVWGIGCSKFYEQSTFDPRVLERDERLNAGSTSPRLRPLPTTLEATPTIRRGTTTLPSTLPTTGPSLAPASLVRLSLREILLRSVANSGEVRVAGYDPAINAMRVIEAEARFDPRIFANFSFERQDTQTAGQVIPNPTNPFATSVIDVDRADTTSIEAGIRQLLPSGGEISVSYLTQYQYFNPRRFQLNNFWDNQLRLEVTQPLLRDFGAETNAARIRIARNDQRISVLDFRRTLEENLAALEQAYWQLYQATTEVQIIEELLLQTIETYSTLLDRFVRGIDASQIQVRQAEGAVHQRKAALIDAKQRVRDLSNEIKRRMNDPEFPVGGPAVIVPDTLPLLEPINFETQAQINAALEYRLELGQQLLRIDSAAIAQAVAKNALLPRLDLVGTVGFNGVDQNYGGSFRNLAEFNNLGASIGLQFEYPLGNREARSIYRRSQLQRLQAIEQYRNVVGIVALDVVTALNEIDSNWQQVEANQQGRLSFADQLRLIQRQEDIGGRPLTPEFVNVKLQAQSDLANARRSEAASIAAYNNALQRLERAKGTLLKYDNIMVEEDKTMTLLPK